MAVIVDIKVRQDAEDALVFLGGNLLLGEIFDRDGVNDGVDGLDAEFHRCERDGLGGTHGDVLDLP